MASHLSLAVLLSTVGTLLVMMSFDFMEAAQLLSSSSSRFIESNAFMKNIKPKNDSSTAATDNSGFPPALLRVIDDAMRPRARTIVSTCGMGGCGGLADRARGVAFVASLAILTDRQLVVHPSIMTNGGLPLNFTGAARYWFRSRCDEEFTIEMVWKLLNTTEEVVYVTSICYQMSLWEGAFQTIGTPTTRLHLAELRKECSLSYQDAYYCGAAILQQVEAFRGPISQARHLVDSLGTLLPEKLYTVIQVRAGGSSISIGNSTVKALAWEDGYSSETPQLWIEAFRTLNYSDCKQSVAVVSDSSRVLAELRHAALDRIMISHCCNQPLHRDHTKREEFFFQEVVDLLVIAKAHRIIAGSGHFVDLGRVWLGRGGPELVRISTRQSIDVALRSVFNESECTFF